MLRALASVVSFVSGLRARIIGPPVCARCAAFAFLIGLFACATPAGFNSGPFADSDAFSSWTTPTEVTVDSVLEEFQPEIRFSGRINAIAVHPEDEDLIFVTSESGGLFRSDDGAETWTALSGMANASGDYLPFYLEDVVIGDPSTPGGQGFILVTARRDNINLPDSTVSGGGIWLSKDGGKTWTHPPQAVPKPDPVVPGSARRCPQRPSAFGVEYVASQNAYYVATECGVSRTTDHGDTWTHFDVSVLSTNWLAGRVGFHDVTVLKSGRIVAAGTRGVAYSNDDGQTWIAAGNAPRVQSPHALEASSVNDAYVWAVNWTHGQLHLSDDGGATWTDLSTSTPDYPSLTNHPPTTFVAVGGTEFVVSRPFTKSNPTPLDQYNDNLGAYIGLGEQIMFGNGLWTYVAFIPYPLTVPLGPQGPDFTTVQWTRLRDQHADSRHVHVVPASNGTGVKYWRPWLAANDGGLEVSTDGLTWPEVGSGPGKLNALQIYEIRGTRFEGSQTVNFLFGTQDNHFWASSDGAQTWPFVRGNEGAMIQLPRVAAAADFSGTLMDNGSRNRWRYRDFDIREPSSGPDDFSGWPNPPGEGSAAPILVPPKAGTDLTSNYRYIQWTEADPTNQPGVNTMWITDTFGASWQPLLTGTYAFRSNPWLVDADDRPVVFEAIEDTSTTHQSSLPLIQAIVPAHHNWYTPIGLMTIFPTQALADGLPAPWPAQAALPVSFESKGLGQLGRRNFQFHWTPILAVDPLDHHHLIAADNRFGQVSESFDMGATWKPLDPLMSLMLDNGRYHFHHYRQRSAETHPLLSAIAFHPTNPDLAVAGARQGGLFTSFDRGQTWHKVPTSERLVNVTDFFWVSEDEVIVATYGRGLWKLTPREPATYLYGEGTPPEGIGGPFAIPDGTMGACVSLDCMIRVTEETANQFLVFAGGVPSTFQRVGQYLRVVLPPGVAVSHHRRQKESKTPVRRPSPRTLMVPANDRLLETLEASASPWGLLQPIVGLVLDSNRAIGVITAKSALPSLRPHKTVRRDPAPPRAEVEAQLARLQTAPRLITRVPRTDDGRLTVQGVGLPANVPFEARFDDRIVGRGTTNGSGVATVEVEKPGLTIGTHQVVLTTRPPRARPIELKREFDVRPRDDFEQRSP